MLTPPAAEDLVKKRLFPGWQQEREKLDKIDRWYRWQHEDIKLPQKATPELRALWELSKTPWLGLVVTSVAQCLFVDGFRSDLDQHEHTEPATDPAASGDHAAPAPLRGPWRTWRANKLHRRQIAIQRAALGYGYSYETVLPGTMHGQPTAVMRGVSPRDMFTLWADPIEDDWPMFALRVDAQPGDTYMTRLFDEEDVHFVGVEAGGTTVTHIESRRHGAQVCPVVRFANMLDLEGRTPGEVEPFIPAAQRINKTAFDRLLTQHFAGWSVRTVAGMVEPETDAEKRAAELKLRQTDLLIAEDPDTKFGTLPASPLDPMVGAWRADIEALAAVSQTAAHELTGQLVNLSAEALAAARAGLTRKAFERQQSFGDSHVQALQLAAFLEGDHAYAEDLSARVTWQDMEIRSMAQAVDALGKAAQMLGVPVEALWQRIPGVEKSDVDDWRAMAEHADPLARMQAELARQADTGARTPAPPDVVPPTGPPPAS